MTIRFVPFSLYTQLYEAFAKLLWVKRQYQKTSSTFLVARPGISWESSEQCQGGTVMNHMSMLGVSYNFDLILTSTSTSRRWDLPLRFSGASSSRYGMVPCTEKCERTRLTERVDRSRHMAIWSFFSSFDSRITAHCTWGWIFWPCAMSAECWWSVNFWTIKARTLKNRYDKKLSLTARTAIIVFREFFQVQRCPFRWILFRCWGDMVDRSWVVFFW